VRPYKDGSNSHWQGQNNRRMPEGRLDSRSLNRSYWTRTKVETPLILEPIMSLLNHRVFQSQPTDVKQDNNPNRKVMPSDRQWKVDWKKHSSQLPSVWKTQMCRKSNTSKAISLGCLEQRMPLIFLPRDPTLYQHEGLGDSS
jgi:hypothetical protein